MIRIVFLTLLVGVLAAPNDRVRRYYHDGGLGYGGGGGGGGGGFYGGHAPHGGVGGFGHVPVSQSFSKSSASASSVSSGGTYGKK